MAFALDALDQPVVRATVSRPDDSQISAVDIDYAAEPAFDLANRLWALV